MKKTLSKVRFTALAFLYGVILSVLFLYSFTQVDLNLTLSQISLANSLQDFFQHIGFFERPISTLWYIVLISALFLYYGIFLYLSIKRRLSLLHVCILIGITVGILFVSYPAFSYDIFNYLFDARIVTLYKENPYFHKALDYPADPWINFMRWTHRTYPYGPSWLLLTIPVSFLGFQKLLLTILLFKGLMALSFITASFFLYQILKITKPDVRNVGLVFFSLNPLVFIESLVSAHHDIVMVAFVLASLFFLLKKHHFVFILSFIMSIGIKFVSALLVIPLVFYWLRKKIDCYSWDRFVLLSAIVMLGGIFLAITRTNFQPWYLLFYLPFIALLPDSKSIMIIAIFHSIIASFWYVVYIYYGTWVISIVNPYNIYMLLVVICLSVLLCIRMFKR